MAIATTRRRGLPNERAIGAEAPFDRVVASYHRAREMGELFDTFYRLFLGKAPELPTMFAHTNFPHQKLMLRESLLRVRREGNQHERTHWRHTLCPLDAGGR